MSAIVLIRDALITATLVAASYFDFKERRIPNYTVLAVFVCGFAELLYTIVSERGLTEVFGSLIFEKVLGFIVAILICIGGRLLSKEGLGAGDIKMLAALGFALGINEYLQMLVFTAMGSLAVTVVLLVLHKIEKNTALPFAPYMALGIVAIFLKDWIGG